MSGHRAFEPTRPMPAVDPWASVDDTQPIPELARPSGRRRIYGRVYELFVQDQAPDGSEYVGMTTRTIHQRVHGPSGHTCPADVARDPWKAGILAGSAGYRQLEVVYETGEGERADDAALRRAEAFWIERLNPRRNDVRPVRPRPGAAPRPARSAARPVPAKRPARRPASRSGTIRTVAFAVLALAFTLIFGRMVSMMSLPWPAAPFVVGPMLGVGLAWRIVWAVSRAGRALVRGTPPPRRRRRR